MQKHVIMLMDARADAFAYATHHRRAQLVILTEKGQQTFGAATGLQAPWINALAEGLKVSELETAHSVIARLRQKLEGEGDAEDQA